MLIQIDNNYNWDTKTEKHLVLIGSEKNKLDSLLSKIKLQIILYNGIIVDFKITKRLRVDLLRNQQFVFIEILTEASLMELMILLEFCRENPYIHIVTTLSNSEEFKFNDKFKAINLNE